MPGRLRSGVAVATAGALGLVSALALNGSPGAAHGASAAPVAGWTQHATLTRTLRGMAASAIPSASYYAYVAPSTGDEIIEVNVRRGDHRRLDQPDTADGWR